MKHFLLACSLFLAVPAVAADFLQPSQTQLNAIQNDLNTCNALFFTQPINDCLSGKKSCPTDSSNLNDKARSCFINAANNIVNAFYPSYKTISQDLNDLIIKYDSYLLPLENVPYKNFITEKHAENSFDYLDNPLFKTFKQYKITQVLAQNVAIMPSLFEKILLAQNELKNRKKSPFVNPLFGLTLDPYSTVAWETHLSENEIFSKNGDAYAKYSCELTENKLFSLSYNCHSYHSSTDGKNEESDNREEIISYLFNSNPISAKYTEKNEVLITEITAPRNSQYPSKFSANVTLIIYINPLPNK